MTGVRTTRIFWIGAAGTLVLAALVGISSLLRSDFSQTDWQILLTLVTLVVAAGTAVAGLGLVERGRPGGWVPVGIALGSFAVIVAATWDAFDGETLAKCAVTAAFALGATLLCATQVGMHRGGHAWLVVVTSIAAGLAFAFSTAAVWEESGETWKVAASLWIVAVVGWLNLPLLQRLAATGRTTSPERVLATLDDVELVATQAHGVAVELAPGERLLLRRRRPA